MAEQQRSHAAHVATQHLQRPGPWPLAPEGLLAGITRLSSARACGCTCP
jgi:hypothetical protein